MRRIGKLYVNRRYIEDVANKAAEEFADVMHFIQFIPYQVTYNYERDAFEYFGYSKFFDKIDFCLRSSVG